MNQIQIPDRKPKEIKAIKNAVLEALACDLPTRAALRRAGISEDEFEYLCVRDPHFYEDCKSARSLVEETAIMNVAKSVLKGNVRDSKWLLERTNDKYSKKSDVRVGGYAIEVPVEDKEKELETVLAKYGVIEAEIVDE